ncbi:MAG: translation initiation factor IF-3 [Thermodesulfobacteriota bacterium]
MNSRVRAPEVRLIDVDGSQLGVVNTKEALNKAQENGVDLVEVAPGANPPVCRLMDYGKYKYELKKNQASKKPKAQTVKEIKLRPNIGIHDLNVKINHIKEFLLNGHKTRVRIFFRGREIVHPELGRKLAERIHEELKEISTVDLEPKLEGKNLIMVLSPVKKS